MAGFFGGWARRVVVVGVLALAVVGGQLLVRHPDPDPPDVARLSPSAAEADGIQGRFRDSLASQGIPVGQLVDPGDSFQQLGVAIRRADGSGSPSPSPPAAAEISLTVTDRKVRTTPLQKERAFELSPDRLLIVAVSSDGQARWATTVADPTLVRAEMPDETGALSGQVLYLPQAELLVRVPTNPVLTRVDVYRVTAPGGGSAPQLLGSVPLG